jgi:hypothetical protein
MRQVLIKTFVKFPRNQTVLDVVNGFAKLGFPQTIGAIDGTHMPNFKYGPSTSSK